MVPDAGLGVGLGEGTGECLGVVLNTGRGLRYVLVLA